MFKIMKKIFTKVLNWLKTSNRGWHLTGGIIIGLGANDWYCAEYAGAGIAGALEFKDRLYGNKWDMVDMLMTIVGANVGFLIRKLLF